MTRRRYLTARERRELYRAQDGLCGCGRELGTRWDVDHAHALCLGGDNEADNLRGLCLRCHKAKTKDDSGRRAKVGRITGKTASQWKGTHRGRGRLQSRGFGR